MYVIVYTAKPSYYDPEPPVELFTCDWVPAHDYALTDSYWLVPGTEPFVWEETGSDDD